MPGVSRYGSLAHRTSATYLIYYLVSPRPLHEGEEKVREEEGEGEEEEGWRKDPPTALSEVLWGCCGSLISSLLGTAGHYDATRLAANVESTLATLHCLLCFCHQYHTHADKNDGRKDDGGGDDYKGGFVAGVLPILFSYLPSHSLFVRLGAKLGLLTLCQLEGCIDTSTLLLSTNKQSGNTSSLDQASSPTMVQCQTVLKNILSTLRRSTLIKQQDAGALDVNIIGLVSAMTFLLQQGVVDLAIENQEGSRGRLCKY